MAQSTKCLILLAVIALFFVTEIIPLAVTAMGGAIACGLLGFIPAKQVFSGLFQSAGGDDVRRRTYQSDDTAQTAGECQRHQFGRSRDLCCCAHT